MRPLKSLADVLGIQFDEFIATLVKIARKFRKLTKAASG